MLRGKVPYQRNVFNDVSSSCILERSSEQTKRKEREAKVFSPPRLPVKYASLLLAIVRRSLSSCLIFIVVHRVYGDSIQRYSENTCTRLITTPRVSLSLSLSLSLVCALSAGNALSTRCQRGQRLHA